MEDNTTELAQRLSAVIELAIDGIITISQNGIIESINISACNLFEYEPDEVIGHNIKMLMPEPDKSRHDQYLHNYHKTRKPKIIGIGREVVGRKKSGQTFPFRLAVSEVVLHNRLIFTGIVHDLTEIKKARENLQQANYELENKVLSRTNQLEEAMNQLITTNKKLIANEEELNNSLSKEKELNSLKSRFVAMASHEFRTPLSTILSSASLIGKYETHEQQEKRQKHIHRIKNAVQHLTGILNDILSLSKIEEGKESVDSTVIEMGPLVDTIHGEVKSLITHNKTLTCNLEDDRLIIYSDPKILKNIIFNLISNAIKYTRENGEILCTLTTDTDHVHIVIIDDGIGIPENEQQFLFDRFFRASNVDTIQGTGLGLNIVKRYVELLDGTITFESEEGKGSKFMVKLPINRK